MPLGTTIGQDCAKSLRRFLIFEAEGGMESIRGRWFVRGQVLAAGFTSNMIYVLTTYKSGSLKDFSPYMACLDHA